MRTFSYGTAFLGVLVLSVGSVIGQQAITRHGDAGAAQAKKVNARITALQTARRDLLHQREQMALARYRQGLGTLEEMQGASRDAIQADLDLAHTHAERIALLQKWVDMTEASAKLAQDRYNAGTVVMPDVLEARAGHLEAEIALEREKGS